MSYILDAIKKSDQQRQRGTTPTLLTSQVSAIALKQPAYLFYGMLVAILVCAGIVIGWLRPWQQGQALPAIYPVSAKSSLTNSQLTTSTTQSAFSETPQQTMPNITTPSMPRTVARTLKAVVIPARKEFPLTDAPPDQRAIWPRMELPASIQQEIPKMSISGLVYSDDPGGRLVGINDRLIREGEYLAPGLRLEQITTNGVIFSYKKYRFRP